MRKRKNDEPVNWWGRIATVGLGLGLLLLVIFSTGTVGWMITHPPTPTQTPYPTYAPSIVMATPYPVYPTTTPAVGLPADIHLVVTGTNGEIWSNSDGPVLKFTGFRGSNVVVSPDSHTLAYLRSGQLYLARDNKEIAIPGLDSIQTVGWSADSTALILTMQEESGIGIYWLPLDTQTPNRLLIVDALAAPPVANPAGVRLLLTEPATPAGTTFYTLELAACIQHTSCRDSRNDLLTIPDIVTGITYQFDATAIVFAEREGRLYRMAMGSKTVDQLKGDGIRKQHPALSPDGRWLAYLDDGGRLYVTSANGSERIAFMDGLTSVDWLG